MDLSKMALQSLQDAFLKLQRLFSKFVFYFNCTSQKWYQNRSRTLSCGCRDFLYQINAISNRLLRTGIRITLAPLTDAVDTFLVKSESFLSYFSKKSLKLLQEPVLGLQRLFLSNWDHFNHISQKLPQNGSSTLSRGCRDFFRQIEVILILLLKNSIRIALRRFPEALETFFKICFLF